MDRVRAKPRGGQNIPDRSSVGLERRERKGGVLGVGFARFHLDPTDLR